MSDLEATDNMNLTDMSFCSGPTNGFQAQGGANRFKESESVETQAVSWCQQYQQYPCQNVPPLSFAHPQHSPQTVRIGEDPQQAFVTPAEEHLSRQQQQQQHQQQQQVGAGCTAQVSSAALYSLTMTAASVGMNLDQFAHFLSNSSALAPVLDQKQRALNCFSAEVESLCTRSMLAANYNPEVANDPTSSEYLDFAHKAWTKEGQRLLEITKEFNETAELERGLLHLPR